MLPEILAGSYKRYKEDTNVFTTWLSHKAVACGYRPAATLHQPADLKPKPKVQAAAPVKSQRLKGKDRKLAKQAAGKKENAKPGPSSSNDAAPLPGTKYTISTQDLLRQAEAIAQSTADAIHMPLGIQRVLERAIEARKRCAQWFDQIDDTRAENAYSRDGHRHFIDVLQTALDLLKAHTDTAETGEASNTGGGAAGRGGLEAKPVETLRNKFEILEVEDVDETLDMTAANVATSSKTSKRDVYELELDPTWDAAFDIFCFFEDLHRIEGSLNQTWRRYQAGELDLLTATMVTDAAISLVRRAETDLHETFGDLAHTYEGLSGTIFYAETFNQGQDPDEYLRDPDRTLRVTELDEFIYLPVGRTLIKFARMSEPMQKAAWPVPVPPMRFSYVARPQFLELPGMAEKEHEDKVLTQLLLDLVLADELKKGTDHLVQTGREVDARRYDKKEDEFTRCVRPLWTEGLVTVQSVFASRILLNIIAICKGKPKFYHGLVAAAERVEKSFDFFVDSSGALDTGGGVRWLTKDTGLLMGIYDVLHLQIRGAPFRLMKKHFLERAGPIGGGSPIEELPPEVQAEIRARRLARGEDVTPPTREHVENAKKLNIQWIKPAESGDFIFTHNPLFCGTLAMQLAVSSEEAGVALANHHLSIFATAHLYNSLRQLGITPVRWPVIERISQMHIGPIFAGELPTTPEAVAARLVLRLGGSSIQNIRQFDKRKPWKIQSTEVSRTLRAFFEQRESFERSLYALEGHMQEHTLATTAGSTAKHAKRHQRKQLTPLQFLAQMEAYLPAVLPDMELDYVTLTKTCNTFMKRLRSHIHQKLGILHPSVTQVPGDTNDHGNLYMVLAILNDSREAARSWERLPARTRSETPFLGGLQLRVAGEALEAFWDSNDGPGGSA